MNLPWNIYSEAFFPEVFVEDGTVTTGFTGTAVTFNNPTSAQYGTSVTGNLVFDYPFDTSVSGTYLDNKITLRWQGGYSAVWASIDSLTFWSYTKLWANPTINQIVLLMPSHTLPYTETLSVTGLVNPYPYQRSIYEWINIVTLTFYQNFQTTEWRTAIQPSYSIYTRNPSPLIVINQTSPTNNLDIYSNANTLPSGMFTIMRLQITVGETYANLNTRKLHRMEVVFSAGVGTIRNCWVSDWLWSYYSLVSSCTVNSAGNAIELFGFVNTRISSGINVLVELSVVSSPITY